MKIKLTKKFFLATLLLTLFSNSFADDTVTVEKATFINLTHDTIIIKCIQTQRLNTQGIFNQGTSIELAPMGGMSSVVNGQPNYLHAASYSHTNSNTYFALLQITNKKYSVDDDNKIVSFYFWAPIMDKGNSHHTRTLSFDKEWQKSNFDSAPKDFTYNNPFAAAYLVQVEASNNQYPTPRVYILDNPAYHT